MIHETITLDCEAFGFLDLDVMYEEVVDDHSFDHEFGTQVRVDAYVMIHKVSLNDQPIILNEDQIKDLEDFITDNLL